MKPRNRMIPFWIAVAAGAIAYYGVGWNVFIAGGVSLALLTLFESWGF